MNHKPFAIIVDLDGTLCNADHRLHHIEKKPKDWSAFFEAAIHDKPNDWCVALILAHHKADHSIVFMTGRDENDRPKTREWLSKHLPDNIARFSPILMRAIGDRRQDYEVKAELYTNHVQPYFDVLFAVDDKHSIARMWRRLGVPALQCAHWEEDTEPNVHKEISEHFASKGAKS